MRKKESRSFVKVQARTITIHVPASAVERLVEKNIISYDERFDPPFVLDSQFDDLALAIPGSFVTR